MDMSFSSGIYYRHSGKFSLGGVLFAVALGLAVGVASAWLYAWLVHWDPIIYINILACVGFSIAIGTVVSSTLKSHKCRNAAVAGAATLLVAATSFYASWVVWLHALTNMSTTALLQHPIEMWRVILYVNENGAWSVRGDVVKGIPLWVVWGSEAACILGLSVYTVVHAMQEATYCEGCDRYAKLEKAVCQVRAGAAPSIMDKKALKSYLSGLNADAAELKQHLEVKDLAYVEQLGAVQPGTIAWYDFDLASCPQCNMTNTLSVTQRQRVETKKGKAKVSQRSVLRRLLLSATEADAIRKTKEKLKTASSQQAATGGGVQSGGVIGPGN